MTEENPTSKGRPSKYSKEIHEQVMKLALLGCTDIEICNFIEIGETTLNVWKEKHPNFRESLKQAKYDSDAEVVASLRKRAIGYTQKEEKIWIDEPEAMELLGIKSKSEMWKMRSQGKIRFSQPSRKIIKYDRPSILKFLEDNVKDKF